MGYARKLFGVAVRSLNVCLRSEQRNTREPHAVFLVCSLGVADGQRGLFMYHSSSDG